MSADTPTGVPAPPEPPPGTGRDDAGPATSPVAWVGALLGLTGRFWTGRRCWRARALTVALVALTAGQIAVQVLINLWSASLFDALEARAMDRFLSLVGLFAGLLAGGMTITATHLLVKRRLQYEWRRWLTGRLLGEWMAEGRQYQITYLPGEHDNPDGRIAEDIRITTEYAVDLAHSFLYCLLLLLSFTQILWALSGSPTVGLFGITVTIPGHLVWIALLYASAGTTLALLLGRPLVRAVHRRQAAEADFRFGLAQGREDADAIALLRGEAAERRRALELFAGIGTTWRRQTRALTNIMAFTSSYSILSVAFPVVVAAPRYIAGTITLGVLMQCVQGFQQMAAALSWPIDNLAKVADWRASVDRVLGLHTALGTLATGRADDTGIRIVRGSEPRLDIVGLTIREPNGTPVITGYHGAIRAGERVLVSGDPGAAVKLLKAVAGLWPWGSGRIALPAGARITVLPHRAYMPAGTLAAALSYPDADGRFTVEAMRAALRRVGLGYLSERLGDRENWRRVMATAERQRFGVARLLLHGGDWIIMQEATDALDHAGVAEMMAVIHNAFPDAAVFTVGFHGGLEAFHDRLLVLERGDSDRHGDGTAAAATVNDQAVLGGQRLAVTLGDGKAD